MSEDALPKSSVGVVGAGIQGVCISLCLIKKANTSDYNYPENVNGLIIGLDSKTIFYKLPFYFFDLF